MFQMVILAAYDRRPFTMVAKGWEPIWGLTNTGKLLPAILRNARLYKLSGVLVLPKNDIQRRPTEHRFFNYRLDSDGANTRYYKTFKDAAGLVSIGGLLHIMKSAAQASDVKKIHELIDSVHGIGPTIVSKLVMYILREIRVSDIDPVELYSAVKPILTEYHNARLVKDLLLWSQQPNIIERVFETLKEIGDPFAIDALYYVDRDEPKFWDFLMRGI